MVRRLGTIDNTVQYSWLIEAARTLFGFRGRRLTAANWEGLAAAVAKAARPASRYRDVLRTARLEKVFLTNQFDEDLVGIAAEFVPCLRADDLVFRLADPAVRRRVTEKTGIEVGGLGDLRKAVASLMEYFVGHGAASAAIGLPPRFVPDRPDEAAAERGLGAAVRGEAATAGGALALERFAFDLIAAACADRRKPFQLMIGACRGVYPAGVDGGRDLLSKEGTLMQYADLFRRYGQVDFTVSILSTTWAHELATFAWIVPNVKPSGHWWYTNVPAHIEADLRARLEAVPKVKLIGYYSDMYKVEFGLPKFNMYRRILAKVLAEDFVEEGRMTEDEALETARLLLYENPKRIFGV
jgi:glucuronate isomerase